VENAKVCTMCGIEKGKTEFYKNKAMKDGLASRCKQCDKKYYQLNKQKRKDQNKKLYEDKREKILEQKKEYYERNKEKIKKGFKKYRKENPEKIARMGKNYWDQNKEQIRKNQLGYREKNREKLRAKAEGYRGEIVSYEIYATQLTVDEAPEADEDGYLMVKCTYCGRHFYPKRNEVQHRTRALIKTKLGESRLYCTNDCKQACPVYNTQLWPRGYKPATSREVQAELRQMRLLLDDYECQKCGKNIDEAELHCHHYTGTMQNPIESADVDNTITVCKECHKWVHTQEGCRYFELRCT
jgi:5-methylcytosine-specific restriction endonuclease McrA